MLLFLIAEIAGGAYIYNQQDEFLDKLHKTISKAVEKDYSNAPEVTFKLDLIQSGVRVAQWINPIEDPIGNNQINCRQHFIVEMLRDNFVQDLVQLRFRQAPNAPRFHLQFGHLQNPQIVLHRPEFARLRDDVGWNPQRRNRKSEIDLPGGEFIRVVIQYYIGTGNI